MLRRQEAASPQPDLTGRRAFCRRPPRGRSRAHLLLLSLLCLLVVPSVAAASRLSRQTTPGGPPEQPIYRTVHVTRACEWKSNLFVPKSNDILFAQPTPSSDSSPSSSSVVYETFGQSGRQPTAELGARSTLLNTDSEALVLALPIVFSPSFAGYEPACSIRLIVPRNMRILAKLSSRRLAFAQEQLQEAEPASGEPSRPSLWKLTSRLGNQLNVSQDQFSETEQRSFESESNVLAFRFLLDRFAYRHLPDARFQVILTAFQTLSENSDLSGQQQVAGPANAPLGQAQQFICDQQRLISANLACDGFKNCQDGHDEEMATCLALRNAANLPPPPPQPDDQRQLGAGRKQPTEGDRAAPIWVQVRQFARDSSSLAAFLVGFLLILALLVCCTCCVYLSVLLWRRRRQRRLSAEQAGAEDKSGSRAEDERAALAAGAVEEPKLSRPPPARLQSILKRPARPSESPPPRPARLLRRLSEHQEQLERHHQIQQHQRLQQFQASQQPPPPARRGALASQLSGAGPGGANFRPTPAQRATRPTRPVPPTPVGARPAELRHLSTSSTSTTERTTITKTGTHRVTTYEYQATSGAQQRLSESLLQRLSNEGSPTGAGQGKRDSPRPTTDIIYHSTQSSLI